MKKAPLPVPPRPKTRADPTKIHSSTMQSFYGIVYQFDQSSKWQAVIQDYIKINFVAQEYQSEHSYRLRAIHAENQIILDYIITSSTKASVKGTFVRWSNESFTHGARFSKPEVAQEFCDQLCALAMDLLARINMNQPLNGFQTQEDRRSDFEVASRKASTVSLDSNSTMNTLQRKVSGVKVDMLLSNDESRQLLVDSETLVSGLLDKICKDELLTPSFYTIHYVIPAHTPVPLTCKMANLHSNQLRLVDRRGLQKSLSLDKRKAPIDSKRGSITSVRSMRDGRLATPNKVDKDFVLDASHPLVRAFLDIANIHQYELKKPRVHTVVEEFIAERGGLQYLKQLRDSKLSRAVLDEIGEISQKIISLAESPTKFDSEYKRFSSVRENSPPPPEDSYDLRRAYSVGNVSPLRGMEKKNSVPVKKKRQAPLPPGRTKALVHADSLTSLDTKDEKDNRSKSAEPAEVQRVKRKAPLPPGAVSEPLKTVLEALSAGNQTGSGNQTSSRGPPIEAALTSSPFAKGSAKTSGDILRQAVRSSSISPDDQESAFKTPPNILLPPPPDDPPPNEVYSPVGPLSGGTPSPSKQFMFMGELAKRLETRRSLIVPSDEDESIDVHATPMKEHDTDISEISKRDNDLNARDTSNKESDQNRTAEMHADGKKTTQMRGFGRKESLDNKMMISASVEEKSLVQNAATDAEIPPETSFGVTDNLKVVESRLKGKTLKDPKRTNSTEMDAGYSVGLLENQMKTIRNSIRLLQESKDDKQKDVMLKPLLLQQTILQKMIDQERLNVVGSHETEDETSKDGLNGSNSSTRTERLANEELEVGIEEGGEANDGRKKLIPNFDMSGEDVLAVNKNMNIGGGNAKNEETEVERWAYEKERSEEEERRRREEVEKAEDARKQFEEQRRKEVEDEQRRLKEEQIFIENEKQKKRELELQKQEEEKNRLATEKLQEQIRKQKEYLKQKQLMEEEWKAERKRKEAEQRQKDEEEKEKERLRKEELQKKEEFKRLEDEKRLMEQQKMEIEFERKRREEERRQLEEEVQKLKAEEEQRKKEEAAIRKREELKELERMRKELELHKKTENERLEKERKEIEELKRQLKEQRELQEREALARANSEQKQLQADELKLKRVEEKQVFNAERNVSQAKKETSENELAKAASEHDKQETEIKENTREEVNEKIKAHEETFSMTAGSGSDETGHSEKSQIAVGQNTERSYENRYDQKQNGGMRRPSANFVSSAMRATDGEGNRKPAVGLYAKIQQMASAKVNGSAASNGKTGIKSVAKEQTEPSRSRLENQVGWDATDKTAIKKDDSRTEGASAQNTTQLPCKEVLEESSSSSSAGSNGLEDSKPPAVQERKDEGGRAREASMKAAKNAASREGTAVDDEKAQDRTLYEAGGFKPLGSQPSAFNAKIFKSMSSFAVSPKDGKDAVATEKGVPGTSKLQAEANSAQKFTTEIELSKLKGDKQQIVDQRKKQASNTEAHERNSLKAKSVKDNSTKDDDVELRQPKDMYFPGFASKSVAFSKGAQKENNNDVLPPDDIDFDFKSDLGSYRPKCISPDDLRSSSVEESETHVNGKASSSANILKTTLGRKGPPQVLLKSLPKTLPKPGKTVDDDAVVIEQRESVKDRIKNFNQTQPDGKEKKKDFINISAIPSRSLEISSGAISSSIMNKSIAHDNRKGHEKSLERGKRRPNLLEDGSKTETVTSEPVQAPSLLRRLSQNSISFDGRNSNAADSQLRETVSGRLNADGGTQGPSELKMAESENEATTSPNQSEAGETVRLGNYASIVEVGEKEMSERDTVTVKKVGGLKIGFGRDKPKVFNV